MSLNPGPGRKPSRPSSRLPAHRCAAPGCSKTVPGEVLMCYPHWRLVPRAAAREVTRTWLALSADPFDQAARAAYNRAREQAIAGVAEHLRTRP